MRIQLVRSATSIVEVNGLTLLVDPMLSPAGAMPPVEDAAHPRRNPLVDLPLGADELSRRLTKVDAVPVTHTRKDHWDAAPSSCCRRTPLSCASRRTRRVSGATISGRSCLLGKALNGEASSLSRWAVGMAPGRWGFGWLRSPASCCAPRASRHYASPVTTPSARRSRTRSAGTNRKRRPSTPRVTASSLATPS